MTSDGEGILPAEKPLLPLKRISPSKYANQQECLLRDVWSANQTSPLLPVSARARLGTAVHRLLEVVGKKMPPIAAITEQLWLEQVSAVEAAMAESWVDRALVPLKRSVPDFEVQGLRALSRARQLAASATPSTGAPKMAGTGFELWVASQDARVGGVIDYAFYDGGIVIRDYKSGLIFESASEVADGSVKRSFVTQLEMYAALYNTTFGSWPIRLEVVPIVGPTVTLPVDQAACSRLVEDAGLLLNNVNEAIRKVDPATPGSVIDLAAPSADTCRSCLFRPQCPAYAAANPQCLDGWPLDIWATVRQVQKLGNGSVAVLFEDSGSGIQAVKGLTPGDRHPALSGVTAGSKIAMFNLQRSFPARDLREGPYTTMYLLGH